MEVLPRTLERLVNAGSKRGLMAMPSHAFDVALEYQEQNTWVPVSRLAHTSYTRVPGISQNF